MGFHFVRCNLTPKIQDPDLSTSLHPAHTFADGLLSFRIRGESQQCVCGTETRWTVGSSRGGKSSMGFRYVRCNQTSESEDPDLPSCPHLAHTFADGLRSSRIQGESQQCVYGTETRWVFWQSVLGAARLLRLLILMGVLFVTGVYVCLCLLHKSLQRKSQGAVSFALQDYRVDMSPSKRKKEKKKILEEAYLC